MRQSEPIAEVEIDDEQRLCIKPATAALPLIYREAMEVHWDAERRRLYSPTPKEWRYLRWFQQIVAAAKEQGVDLSLDSQTRWINVPDEIKASILDAHTHPVEDDANKKQE